MLCRQVARPCLVITLSYHVPSKKKIERTKLHKELALVDEDDITVISTEQTSSAVTSLQRRRIRGASALDKAQTELNVARHAFPTLRRLRDAHAVS